MIILLGLLDNSTLFQFLELWAMVLQLPAQSWARLPFDHRGNMVTVEAESVKSGLSVNVIVFRLC